jgi:hypothetical protein
VVYAFTSEAAALRELAVIKSLRARSCILREFGRLAHRIKGKPFSEAASGLRVVGLPSPLGSRSFDLRVSSELALPLSSRKQRDYTDSLGFVTGPTLVVLHANSEPRPFPTTLEHRLLTMLLRRARTHHI